MSKSLLSAHDNFAYLHRLNSRSEFGEGDFKKVK
jgi:hypothetical protein